ncbi:hypothetical protein K2W90_06490 [Candidatus Babeliales bacterium]|nr:hypothetical protein [Candidatus Babeliales bacterium]
MKFRTIVWLIFLSGPSWLAGAASGSPKYDDLVSTLEKKDIKKVNLETGTPTTVSFFDPYDGNTYLSEQYIEEPYLVKKNINGLEIFQVEVVNQGVTSVEGLKPLPAGSTAGGYCGHHTNKNLLAAQEFVLNTLKKIPSIGSTAETLIQTINNERYAIEKIKGWLKELKKSTVILPNTMTVQNSVVAAPDEYLPPYTQILKLDKILFDSPFLFEENFILGHLHLEYLPIALIESINNKFNKALTKNDYFIGIKIQIRNPAHYYGLALMKIDGKKIALCFDSLLGNRIDTPIIKFFVQAFASDQPNAFRSKYEREINPLAPVKRSLEALKTKLAQLAGRLRTLAGP